MAAELIRDACFVSGLARVAPELPPHRPRKVIHAIAYREDPIKPTFEVDISDTFDRNLEAVRCFGSQFDEAIQAGLKEGGEAVLARSDEMVPVHDGEIVNSGEVRLDDLTVQVSYKTTGYPYEVDQHEKLELNHPNGGQAKFLETASLEVNIGDYVEKHVKAAFDG